MQGRWGPFYFICIVGTVAVFIYLFSLESVFLRKFQSNRNSFRLPKFYEPGNQGNLKEAKFPKADKPNVTNVTIVQLNDRSTISDTENYEEDTKSGLKLVRILFWTSYYIGTPHPETFPGFLDDVSECEMRYEIKCVVHNDKTLLNESQAVVFHGGADMENYRASDFPSSRNKWQPWVYFTQESPTAKNHDVSGMYPLAIFNWTMSYRLNSDIFHPYFRTLQIQHQQLNSSSFSSRTKLVAWTVSNCRTSNQRKLLADKLGFYVSVHVFGACGNFSCSRKGGLHPDSCIEQIAKHYKFYLAFENSLCKDYITEKPWNALRHGVIPIVYGLGRYDLLLPPNSYIDVRNFNSVRDLAFYISYLDKNPIEYEKYFEWKRDFTIAPSSGWCTLCKKLALKEYPMEKWYESPNNESFYKMEEMWPRFYEESGLLRELGFPGFDYKLWQNKTARHPECIA